MIGCKKYKTRYYYPALYHIYKIAKLIIFINRYIQEIAKLIIIIKTRINIKFSKSVYTGLLYIYYTPYTDSLLQIIFLDISTIKYIPESALCSIFICCLAVCSESKVSSSDVIFVSLKACLSSYFIDSVLLSIMISLVRG